MSKTQYNPGKVWPIVKIVARIVQKNPAIADQPDYLKATVINNIPELAKPEVCANCEASMVEYVYSLDYIDALMLLVMGREVNYRRSTGLTFTEANKIRVQHLEDATYAMKSRTTKMSKLGLVAKLKNEDGHQVAGTWVITKRGFRALQGHEVPKSVKVWRGKIEARGDEVTTLSREFQYHTDKVELAISKNKEPASDHRESFSNYRPSDWYSVEGPHEGNIF